LSHHQLRLQPATCLVSRTEALLALLLYQEALFQNQTPAEQGQRGQLLHQMLQTQHQREFP